MYLKVSTALGAKINFSISEKDAACWFSIVKLSALGWAQPGASRRQPWQRVLLRESSPGKTWLLPLCSEHKYSRVSKADWKINSLQSNEENDQGRLGDWEPGVPSPSFVCLCGCARLLAALWDFSPFLLGGQSWVMLQRLQIIMRAFPKCKSGYSCLGFLYGLLITKQPGFFVSMHFLNCLISSPLYYMLQGKMEILKNCDRLQNEGTGSLLAL